jgi:CRISPR/Cas system CSM-associated protein Csm3 (group 7 of RAMP superfamily)
MRFERKPKPYAFIEFEGEIRKNPLVSHAEFKKDKYTGVLEADLKALTPIHIASGLFELANNQVVKGFTMLNGRPIIPGTSLKGVIRSVVEATTNPPSCVTIANKEIRDKIPRGLDKQCRVDERQREICVTCSIFGALGYRGRISFSDAIIRKGSLNVQEIPQLFQPRDNAPLYYNQKGRIRGRKFYFHGVPAKGKEPALVLTEGSTLSFKVFFEDFSDQELCLLFTAMGVIGGLKLKLGGGKPACLGTAEITARKLTYSFKGGKGFSLSFAQPDTLEKEGLKNEMEGLSKQDGLINKKSYDNLRVIWKYPSDKECADGPY